MSRLREGRANTARGAAHFLRETVSRVRYGGARGQLTVRAGSGFGPMPCWPTTSGMSWDFPGRGQFVDDPTYRPWVRKCCNTERGTTVTKLHVVLQVKHELEAWPATDGQCWKADLGRGEHLLFVDGGEHPVPPLDDKPHWRNAALAAVRIGLDVPGSFEKVGDQVSYRTTDDRWLDLLRLNVSSAEGSTSTPIAAHDLREKARVIALLANQLKSVGCSLFLVGFLSRKPLSQMQRSTFLPLHHAATFISSVDWGLDLRFFLSIVTGLYFAS